MPIQWTKKLRPETPELDAQHLELDGQLALVHDAICEIEIGNWLARSAREHQRYGLQLAAYVRQTNPTAPAEVGP